MQRTARKGEKACREGADGSSLETSVPEGEEHSDC